MTRKKALELAQAKYGRQQAFVRDTRHEWSETDRQRSRAALQALRAREPKFRPLEEWPADATVAEYRDALARFKADRKAWQAQCDSLLVESLRYRYSVGAASGAFGMIHGQGDSWEEALTKAGVAVAVPA
jgi:hypothetical protein